MGPEEMHRGRRLEPEVEAGLQHLRESWAAVQAASDEFPAGYDPVRSYEVLLRQFEPETDPGHRVLMDAVKSRFQALVAEETGSPGVPPAERWVPLVDADREDGLFDQMTYFTAADEFADGSEGPFWG